MGLLSPDRPASRSEINSSLIFPPFPSPGFLTRVFDSCRISLPPLDHAFFWLFFFSVCQLPVLLCLHHLFLSRKFNPIFPLRYFLVSPPGRKPFVTERLQFPLNPRLPERQETGFHYPCLYVRSSFFSLGFLLLPPELREWAPLRMPLNKERVFSSRTLPLSFVSKPP